MTDNPSKLRGLFEYVQDLPHSWMKAFVDRTLRVNDPNLDFMKAAIGEKKAQRQIEKTKEIISQDEKKEIHPGTLEALLSSMGHSSLVEAVLAKKRNPSS